VTVTRPKHFGSDLGRPTMRRPPPASTIGSMLTHPTPRPTTMRAYVGTPAGPELRRVPDPQPAPDETLVQVEAFSINRGELGLFARRPEGWRPGQDIAGRVLAPAADGSGPDAGARIVAMVDSGGWATRVAVPVERLAPLADTVEAERAAGFGVAGLTALRALRRGDGLLGARVLITGASGGVGTFAVQLAASGGAEVTALTGSHRSVDLKALGAQQVITSPDEADGDFDLVLESVGGETLLAALRRTAPRGHLVILGSSSGDPAPITISSFRPHAHQTVHPFWVYGSGEPVGEDLADLVRLTARGLLDPVVGWAGSWDHLDRAMQALHDRRVAGKAILRVDHADEP
jgi:NADPH:quinone reductase